MSDHPYPYPEAGPESDYVPDTDEVETAFHEYASQTELSFNGSYPEAPEFADWREAMWGFRRWHAEEIRKAKEEAWDEGYWLGINRHTGPGNPYRKEIE